MLAAGSVLVKSGLAGELAFKCVPDSFQTINASKMDEKLGRRTQTYDLF